MKKVAHKAIGSLYFFMVLVFFGCGGDGSSTAPIPTGDEFADAVVTTWLGVDYSFVIAGNRPDGFTDTDSDGEVDTDDAVNFIQTFRDLGYNIPATTVQGLYENHYTASGYDYPENDSLPETAFSFTKDNSVSQADLQATDWSRLSVGDLIFIDFDQDSAWDYAAVYLGAHGAFTHAVITASDLHDEVVILDLDDPASIIRLDISIGFSDIRTPDYDNIADY